jgi:hypothetical protein
MNEEIENSESFETEEYSSQPPMHVPFLRGLTFLNILLLVFSGAFLILVGTDQQPAGELTRQRWEIAIATLQDVAASLMGKPATSSDLTDPQKTATATVATITKLGDEVKGLSAQLATTRNALRKIQAEFDSPNAKASELSHLIESLSASISTARSSTDLLVDGPDSPLAGAKLVSGQLTHLTEELEQLRAGVAKLLEETESGSGLPGKKIIPKDLSNFLAEATKPAAREAFNRERLDETRSSLVELINGLPTGDRDEFRIEIRDANWLLEALEILAETTPDSFEERVGQFTSLALLTDDVPNGVPEDLTSALSSRSKRLSQLLARDFDDFVASFRKLSNDSKIQMNGGLVERCALLAEVLDEEFVGRFAFLPDWVLGWQEWLDEYSKLDAKAKPSLRLVENSRMLQEGRNLEELLRSVSLPIPAQLRDGLQELASSIEKIEQSAVNAYQLWALEQIELVREFAGEKASEKIKQSFEMGKSDPAGLRRDPILSKLYTDKPAFRKKLGELAGLFWFNGANGVPANPEEVSSRMAVRFGWKSLPELSRALNQDLLEQHLLPIEEGLLRRPIDTLYAEAFQSCWAYLEGHPERESVAKTAATIEKRTISVDLNP